ncbi:MAG: hypothetical protein FWG22_00205 [Prolixibacteraceae bacterium]|nr:hypothetical protein [Prolixibacteraceae bacterium]
MISYHNIHSIAKYERKTLFRSWFFRIFSILAILVLFLMNFGMISENGSSEWIFRAIPSTIPYFNLLILNVAQAIIAVFLASDFLKRDKKLDTTEVIYMRSMTNADYVIGKTIGNLQVFLFLNIIALGIALIFNLIAQNTYVPWTSYLIYLLLISIPTLLYITGLSFLLMTVIRNQAVTFVIILGYIGITLFLVKDYFYYIFDYMAFNIPLLQSSIVGFGNLDVILGHRGIYFCLGVGFISLSIFLLKRLPQSEATTWFSLFFSIIFILAGGFLGYTHVNRFLMQEKNRKMAVAINDRYISLPFADVDKHDIKLNHTGDKLEATSIMQLINNKTVKIDSLILTLNPGLVISEAKVANQTVDIKRRNHLVVVPLKQALQPHESVQVDFSYGGNIDEAYCYLDTDDKQYKGKYYSQGMVNIDKRYAFVTPSYVLLTPEANWYPQSGVTYSPQTIGWKHINFTDFSLEVKTNTELKAASQGIVEEKAPGHFVCKSENPLTQLSLSIGDYEHKKLAIGEIEFGLWHFKGHDTFSEIFEEIKDTIPSLLEERLRDFLRAYTMEYPFKRLTLVETPAQLKPYTRIWTSAHETVQPEIVFIQEKGFLMRDFDFHRQIKQIKKWSQNSGESLTDRDAKIRLIYNVVGNFTRESGRPNFRMRAGGNMQVAETNNSHFIFPMLYNYSNYVRSANWPITNLVLEAYLKSQAGSNVNMWMRDMSGLSNDERASIALQDRSFSELIQDENQRNIVDNLIKLKGDVLFTTIQAKAGEYGDLQFSEFLRGYLRERKFSITEFDDFDRAMEENFNIQLTPMMNNWYNETKLPGYLFSTINVVNAKDKEQTVSVVSFNASNTSDVDGIVKFSFRSGGGGRGPGMRGGPGGAGESIDKILNLAAGETKKVTYLFSSEPRSVTINTMASKNIPQSIMQSFGRIEEDVKLVVPQESEIVIDIPVSHLLPNEIIVDNEDPEFEFSQPGNTSMLSKWVLKEDDAGLRYSGYNQWRAPLKWTLTTNSNFYGLYVRSAYYIKSGNGDQTVTWKLPVKERGQYDVYTYITPMRGGGGRGPGDGRQQEKGEYIYSITHADGTTEQTLQIDKADAGWNLLGSFHFSPDEEQKIVLNNKSTMKTVVADAVKLVKL